MLSLASRLTTEESTPPERKQPSGTSERSRIFTASRRVASNSSDQAAGSAAGSQAGGRRQ